MPEDQFHELFGDDALNGNRSDVLEQLVDDPFSIMDQSKLPAPEEVSLIPAYEQLDKQGYLEKYLTQVNEKGEKVGREFSFYVSQGCAKACSFCTADRNRPGQPNVGEKYRDQGIMKDELEYLINKQRDFGVNELNIYMSNLDVFQTPDELHTFAKNVIDLKEKYEGFKINLRGLACVESYVNLWEKEDQDIFLLQGVKPKKVEKRILDQVPYLKTRVPEVLQDLVKAGFHTVGYGVDGMTAALWNKIGKGHNKDEKYCLSTIITTSKVLGVTPESLMVFGHNKADSGKTLKLAYKFCKDMYKKYGAIPRPHVTKDFAPGNAGWTGGLDAQLYESQVEEMLENPELFQCLDFLALPTVLTHPRKRLRESATKYFKMICGIKGSTSIPIEPVLPGMNADEIAGVRKRNEGRFDR